MERSSDGSLPLKIVLAVVGTATLLAFGYFFGNTQVMLIILGGIVAIALLLFLYRLVLRSGEARRARLATAEIAGATGKRPRELNDPAELAKVADLARKFEEGLEKFRTAGKDLYSIPWYVLVGEPGSGKTEALRHCGVPTPAGLAELPGVGGTINMNWWFTNQAIVLDTAGRLMFQSVEPGKSGEWTEFLKLLGRARPNVPINGLLLVIPADSLIRDSNNKIEEKAKKIALQFDLIQRTLGVRFPVFVLITKADLINGFREFFDTLDDPNTQHQMVGWSNPAPLDAPFDPDHIDRHLESVRKRLLQYRAALMLDPVNTEDAAKRRADQADALYAFPDALTSIGPRLKLYMEMIFVQGEWSPKPLFLRGVYLTSAMREGSALDRELADLLGVPVDQLPEGKIWTRERPQFLKELFTKKVFRERGLVTRASNAAGLQRSRRLALFGGGFAAIVALLVLTWLGYRQLTNNIVGQKDFWTALNKSYTDQKTVVDSRRRVDDKANWSILGGAFDDKTGQELTNAYTFRGYRPIQLGATERPLGKVHSEAAERVRTEIKVPAVFRPLAKFEGNLAAEERKQAYRKVYEETVLKPVVRAAADRMLTEGAWTEETAPISTRALMELIHLEVDAATAMPAAAGEGGMGMTSPLNLDAIFTYVLTPGEYKKFTDNEGTAFQTSLEALYASAAWPPSAVKGLASKALSRGVDRFSEFWTTQATAGGNKRSGPAPVMDLRRDALGFEAALKELTALPATAAQGPDTLARYQELHDQWKTKLAALNKAREAVDRQVQAVEQRTGGWGKDDKLIDLYRAELASDATRAREAYKRLIDEIPQGVPGPLLAIRNRLQKSMTELPDPKKLAVRPEIETELTRLQEGLLAREEERQPRVYELCLASIQQADAQLPSPDPDAAPAPGASAGEDESSADLAGPAGFVRRLERLPDKLKLTDLAITTARQAAVAGLPAPNPSATADTPPLADDVRNTVGWLLQEVAGPFQRYRELNPVINGSGGGAGEDAVTLTTAKQIGAIVAATSQTAEEIISDQFPPIPMTPRGETPVKFVAEYDRHAAPKVIRAWLNLRRQFAGPGGKPRTDVLEIASLNQKYGQITESSFGPYVGEYIKYWSDSLNEADDITAGTWADYQKLLPSKAADANEQLERLCKAVFEALNGLQAMKGAPEAWKIQSRVSPAIAAAKNGKESLDLGTFQNQCASVLASWSALGSDPGPGIKAARRLGVRKFHDTYMMPSKQANPVASYWKNLTYKGLELLGTVESKGAEVDFTADRCFPLAPPKPGVNALDRAKLRDVRKKIVAIVGEESAEPAPSAADAGEGLDAAYRKLYDGIAKKPIAPDEQWLEQGRRMIDALLRADGLTVTISTLPLEAQKKNAAAVKPPAGAVKGVLASEQVQLISVEGGEEPAPAFATSASTLLRNQPIAGKSDEAIQFHFQRQAMPDPADSRFDERVSGSWAGLKMLYPPYIAEQQDAEGKVWHVQLLPKDFEGQQRKYTVWVELKFDKPLVRFPSQGQAPPAAAAAR